MKITYGTLHGKIVAHFHFDDGRVVRRRTGTDDMSAAVTKALAMKIEYMTAGADDLPTSSCWELYCDANSHKVLIQKNNYMIKHIGRVFTDNVKPSAITEELCKSYIAMRRKEGVGDGTIHVELTFLSTVINWAVRKKYVSRKGHIVKPRMPDARDRYLTKAEVRRLIDCCRSPHIRTFVILMYSTGARSNAILDLTWDRVDFQAKRINLKISNANKVPSEADRRIKGRAIVPMNTTAERALREVQPHCTDPKLGNVIEWGGKPVKIIRKAFKISAKEADLGDISPHILRHTAAVHMAEARVPMAEIAQFLGHSNQSITYRVYARYSPDFLQDAASSLEIDF